MGLRWGGSPHRREVDLKLAAAKAIDEEEHRAVEIESAFAEIGEHRFAHRGVLRGALAQREDVFMPVGRDSQG